MTEPLWTPGPDRAAGTNLARFSRYAADRHRLDLGDYADLHRWSVEEPGQFWQDVWDFSGVVAHQDADQVVEGFEQFPGARWFPGARLNFAENLLRYRDDAPALISVMETGQRTQISYAELFDATSSIAAWLEGFIQPGDRVAGWLPNAAEAVIGMLATTALGGVWSSCSPDFGSEGALDRFGQIQPRVLIACDGYHYGGKTFPTVDKVIDVARQIESIEAVLWVSVINEPMNTAGAWQNASFAALLEAPAAPVQFVQREFDDPLYVMYSSGTTGKPKCIVHGIGGTLIQHLKEHRLGRASVLLYYMRLDDVELAGERFGHRSNRSALRRLSFPPPAYRLARPGRRRIGKRLWRERQVPVCAAKGRRGATPLSRPGIGALRALYRLTPYPGRLPLRLRGRQG